MCRGNALQDRRGGGSRGENYTSVKRFEWGLKKKYLKVQHFLIHLKIETDFPNILFNSEERRIIGFDVPAWSRLFSYKGASRIALFLLHRSSPPKITIFVFIIFIRDHD